MRSLSKTAKRVAVLVLFGITCGFSSCQELPVMNGQPVVATVNGEPITLEEYKQELSSLHGNKVENKKAGRIDYRAILDRLITVRLILQEARTMRLGQLPEVKQLADKYADQALIDLLLKDYVKDIKPDEKEVDRLYKESVKEWKINAVVFEKEDTARKAAEEIKRGAAFDALMNKLVTDGQSQRVQEGEYIKSSDILPNVAEILSKTQVGAVSPVFKNGPKFMIFKLEGVRFPDDPNALEQAKEEALTPKIRKAVEDYAAELKGKYIKLDQALFDSLDFSPSGADFEKLREDKRVIAEVTAEEPITVGEFTKTLDEKLYHGVERAAEAKRLQDRKNALLEQMIQNRVFRKEGLRKEFDKTEAYQDRVKESERSVIFSSFVEKVIVRDLKLNDEEIQNYYNEHSRDYSIPELMRIRSIVFKEKKDAEAALQNLSGGTDFNWLSANADGRLDDKTEGLLQFQGGLLLTTSLPEGVRNTLSGSHAGDFKIYESPEGYHYLLSIEQVVPSKPQPIEQIREEIKQKVVMEKVRDGIDDWARKLKKVYPVKIYLKSLL